jgi:hypothetical protein
MASRLILAALTLANLAHLRAAEPTRAAEPMQKSAQKSELVGQVVRIADGAMAYRDLEVVTEAQKALAKGKDIAASKLSGWIKQSRVFLIGINSVGIVTATGGPKGKMVQLESRIKDEEISFWVAAKDITQIQSETERERTNAATFEDQRELSAIKATAENLVRKIFNERLDRVEVYAHIDGGVNVLVFFNAAEGWSIDSTRRRIEADMRDSYSALYGSNLGVTDATMFAHAKTTDKFGKESTGLVYKTSMSKKIADQVVWEKADTLDFTQIGRRKPNAAASNGASGLGYFERW